MRRVLLLLLCACGEAAQPQTPAQPAAPSSAPATPSAPDKWPFVTTEDRAAQDERLAKDPGPIKSNWVPPGHSERYGHAEGIVKAPLSIVRDRIGDFAHYKDLAGPKFKSVKLVDKQGTTTDVYFSLPIMKGLVTIWYVTRFAPPRDVAGSAIVEGTFVKGNIQSMHIAFNARPAADGKATVLMCDLLLALSLPAPQDAVDEELRDACGDAINSVRRTIITP
jgi:hypothetical protein